MDHNYMKYQIELRFCALRKWADMQKNGSPQLIDSWLTTDNWQLLTGAKGDFKIYKWGRLAGFPLSHALKSGPLNYSHSRSFCSKSFYSNFAFQAIYRQSFLPGFFCPPPAGPLQLGGQMVGGLCRHSNLSHPESSHTHKFWMFL